MELKRRLGCWAWIGLLIQLTRCAPPYQENAMTDPHWYVMSRIGLLTLCADEADARESAGRFDKEWPDAAPHRAVQLVAVEDLDAMRQRMFQQGWDAGYAARDEERSEEHTSELQSRENLVCRLLLEQ